MLSTVLLFALLSGLCAPGQAAMPQSGRRALRSMHEGYSYDYPQGYDGYKVYPSDYEHDWSWYDDNQQCYDWYWYYYEPRDSYYRCEYYPDYGDYGSWRFYYEGTWFDSCDWGCYYCSYNCGIQY